MEAAAARLGMELIKQYPAKEQAELKVKVKIPGSWFGGSLTSEERKELYWAQAKDSAEAHRFPKKGQKPATVCPGISFLCDSDVVEDPTHAGFWMPLTEWNRYRHDTYKDDRAAELPFIRTSGDDAAAAPDPAAEPAATSKRGLIFSEFTTVDVGTHIQTMRSGGTKEVKCEFLKCKNTSGSCKSQTHIFKVINSGTHKIREHLKVCNPARFLEISGGSPARFYTLYAFIKLICTCLTAVLCRALLPVCAFHPCSPCACRVKRVPPYCTHRQRRS